MPYSVYHVENSITLLPKDAIGMINLTRRLLVLGAPLGVAGTTLHTVAATMADGHAAGLDVAAAPNPLALNPTPFPARPPLLLPHWIQLRSSRPPAAGRGKLRPEPYRSRPASQAPISSLIPAAAARCIGTILTSGHWCLAATARSLRSILLAAWKSSMSGPATSGIFPVVTLTLSKQLGNEPMHAILAFNDGLYAEHGTFGISDWMSRFESADLAHALGVAPEALAGIPRGESYIMQGRILRLDGPEARAERPWPVARSHRCRLKAGSPHLDVAGGTVHAATQEHFPLTAMASLVTQLQPGAMQRNHSARTAVEAGCA